MGKYFWPVSVAGLIIFLGLCTEMLSDTGLLTLSVNVFDFTKLFLRCVILLLTFLKAMSVEAQNQNYILVYIPSIFYFQTETVRETSKRLVMSRGGSRHFHKGAIFSRGKNRISKQFVLRKIKRYRAVFQSENCKTW